MEVGKGKVGARNLNTFGAEKTIGAKSWKLDDGTGYFSNWRRRRRFLYSH